MYASPDWLVNVLKSLAQNGGIAEQITLDAATNQLDR